MSEPYVCPPEHAHASTGKRTCYAAHKCRCADCRELSRQYNAHRNRQVLYGRWKVQLVDAGPVREHVHALLAAGLGRRQIAILSGVGLTAIEQIIYGRKGSNADPRKGEALKRIQTWKADAILAVRYDPDSAAGGAKVSARGARRRIEALQTQGWSRARLAGMLGMTVANFHTMSRQLQVTAARHRSIVELYDRLWNQAPPRDTPAQQAAYTRTIGYARQMGYVSPLDWDDIDADEAPAVIDDEALDDELEALLERYAESDGLAMMIERLNAVPPKGTAQPPQSD